MAAVTISPLTASVVALALFTGAVFYLSSKPKRLPPGPKGLPLLGNIFDIPKKREWLAYQRWSREFNSDIIHLNLAGNSVIVLNSKAATYDLLEKRSALYSDRPRMPMLTELMGFDYDFSFMKYGEQWRERRKMFSRFFNPNITSKHYPKVMKTTKQLLRRLLDDVDRENFMQHLRLMTGSMILDVVYGIEIEDKYDPFVITAEIVNHALAVAGNMGSFLVDNFPALKYIPSWFPGASFKRKAAEWKKATTTIVQAPFRTVKQSRANGIAPPCMVSTLLGSAEDDESSLVEKEKTISEVAAVAYGAGADTTVSSLETAVLALLLNPDIQRKAQAEIDRVIGSDRLPTLDDIPSLPYITAIVNEVLRWRPVSPLSLAHRLIKDDVYGEYHLPAGSIVIGNSWAVLHDEAVYTNPSKFMPERFLTEDGKLKPDVTAGESAAFGFGRRICPGSAIAIASVWITVATTLSVFNLEKPTDENGVTIEPSGEYTTGTVVYPEPFQCLFKPRSEMAVALIRSSTFESE